jgi:hypothetical protein
MMKHICLDREDDRIKQFVRSLPTDADGVLLELDGSAIFRVIAVEDDASVDLAQLKAAIIKRRDESRSSNAEWESVDQEVWDQTQGGTE